MSNERFVLGTVRARRGAVHIVVTGDGQRLPVRFEAETPPPIGVDVVGLVSFSGQDAYTMRLVPDVAREILKGKVRLSTHGRSDLTARMLARVLSMGSVNVLSPGTGGVIERTPTMSDPDAKWAFDALGEKARAVGIALNVVEPLSVCGQDWSDQRLVEDFLPADATGERGALADMRSIFFGGMNPACRRTFEDMGKGGAVPSVDFIVPYSPFLTGMGYSARLARAFKDEVVVAPLPGHFARKISSWREMSLPFASRYVGRRRTNDVANRQVEQTFADVAATLAVARCFGEDGARAGLILARLRESAIGRWNGHGESPIGSSDAIRAALATVGGLEADVDAELSLAASLARQFAPTTSKALSEMKQRSDGGGFVRVGSIAHGSQEMLRAVYADDVQEVAERLRPMPAALERFSRFSVLETPMGWEACFDEAMAPFMDEVDPEQTYRGEGIDLTGASMSTHF